MERLFLAVPIPEKYRHGLGHYTHALPEPDIRWVDPATYHITVTFFGEQEATNTLKITESVRNVTGQIKPLKLDFDAIRYAPPRKKPSMLWAQYRPNEAFTSVVQDVENTVRERLDYPDKRDGQTPIPHITMARFKELPVDPLPQITLDPITVSEICLFQSERSPDGRKYTLLETFPLSNT